MIFTENLGLMIPDEDEQFDLGHSNYNMDVIDEKTLNKQTGGKITGDLDVEGKFTADSASVENMLNTPWIKKGNWVEGYLGFFKTTANVAHEKINIIFGKVSIEGWFEIELAYGRSNYSNSVGRLCKRFNLQVLSSGSYGIVNDNYYTYADSYISLNVGIGNMKYDSEIGWHITIGKRIVAEQSTYGILIRGFGTNSPDLSKISLSNVYTTDSSVFEAPVPQLPINTKLRSGVTDYQALSMANVTNSAAITDPNMIPSAALINNLQNQINQLNSKTIYGDALTAFEGIAITAQRSVKMNKTVYIYAIVQKKDESPFTLKRTNLFTINSMHLPMLDYTFTCAGSILPGDNVSRLINVHIQASTGIAFADKTNDVSDVKQIRIYASYEAKSI